MICIVVEPSHLYHGDVQHVISSDFNKPWRQPKKNNTTHNTKMMSNTDLTKTGGNTGSHEGKVVPASYKAPTMQHGPH